MTEGTAAAAGERGAVSLEQDERAPIDDNDGVPTLWLPLETLPHTLEELAGPGCARPFLLLDLFALDDGLDGHGGEPAPTVVYVLMRPSPFALLRVKVLVEGGVELPSARPWFSNAAGYERAIIERAGARFASGAEHEAPAAAALVEDGGNDGDELDVERALPRALALEALLGVAVPARAEAIRVLRGELLRVASHLAWYAAFVEAVGASAAASFAPADVRRALEVLHTLGGRDPDGVVVGGVRDDLPAGWRRALESFLAEITPRVQGYGERASSSPRLLDASKGVSPLSAAAATSWGVTGPLLRAAGVACDLRKERPYSGYERYAFQVPAGVHGDVYDRARVRLAELRESLRIVEQAMDVMPDGALRADVPPALAPGEALAAVEGSRGVCACYVASDGITLFVRERTPGSAHRDALEAMSRGYDERARVAIASSVDLYESRP